jgi:hypothetical protein
MLPPVLDIDVGTIYNIAGKLEQAVVMTKDEVGWEGERRFSDTESETCSIASFDMK